MRERVCVSLHEFHLGSRRHSPAIEKNTIFLYARQIVRRVLTPPDSAFFLFICLLIFVRMIAQPFASRLLLRPVAVCRLGPSCTALRSRYHALVVVLSCHPFPHLCHESRVIRGACCHCSRLLLVAILLRLSVHHVQQTNRAAALHYCCCVLSPAVFFFLFTHKRVV